MTDIDLADELCFAPTGVSDDLLLQIDLNAARMMCGFL
jgi:hypothetical protein